MLVFTFTPPPTRQQTPAPCPVCSAGAGLPLYSTSEMQYYRCDCCRQIWAHPDGDPSAFDGDYPAPAAA